MTAEYGIAEVAWFSSTLPLRHVQRSLGLGVSVKDVSETTGFVGKPGGEELVQLVVALDGSIEKQGISSYSYIGVLDKGNHNR